MKRFVAAVPRQAVHCSQLRSVVLGQDEEEYNTYVRKLPKYTETDRIARQQRQPTEAGRDFTSSDLGEDATFEAFEDRFSSRGHQAETGRMSSTRGMPMMKRRKKPPASTDKDGLPEKYGTEVILRRYEAGHVTGWQDEGWTRPRIKASTQRDSTLALYRSFWRVLRKYPKEVRPRLARILRSTFKKQTDVKSQIKKNGLLRLGRKLLLRYIDQLRNFELRRCSHDPVQRFLVMYDEERARTIDNLDFWPYTEHEQELKPLKDIGFHKVYKRFQNAGSPMWKAPNTQMALHVHRGHIHKRKTPKTKSIRRDREDKQWRNGHQSRLDQIIKARWKFQQPFGRYSGRPCPYTVTGRGDH